MGVASGCGKQEAELVGEGGIYGCVTRSYALCILFYLCVCMWILLMSVCMSRLGNHVNIYIYISYRLVYCVRSQPLTSCTVICIRVSEKIFELP